MRFFFYNIVTVSLYGNKSCLSKPGKLAGAYLKAGLGSVYNTYGIKVVMGNGIMGMGKQAVMLECWNGVIRIRTEQLWVGHLKTHKPMGNSLFYKSIKNQLQLLIGYHLTLTWKKYTYCGARCLLDVSWAGGILPLFPYAYWAWDTCLGRTDGMRAGESVLSGLHIELEAY